MLSDTARLVAEGLGAAGALGLAAGGWAYAALYPTSQLFGPTLVLPERLGEIALTFDDGPNPACTPRLLDMLAAHAVTATFFLVGQYAEAEPCLTRHIADSGHIIGNHSWSHPNMALSSRKKIRDELYRTKHALEQITGTSVRYFRPPFGARRPAVLDEARQLGMSPVLWNAMTEDWEEPSADQIAERLARKVDALGRGGRSATVVLHDGGHLDPSAARGPSVAAAEKLMGRYSGVRRFVTAEYLQWGPTPIAARAR
ncbi:MAG TPA: polysaccharide deacetylase family protein [Terracidiphilus sp.]|jgi:peptidoglycan/xylan/chitin deacetylase (PgdA/CDA1 family)